MDNTQNCQRMEDQWILSRAFMMHNGGKDCGKPPAGKYGRTTYITRLFNVKRSMSNIQYSMCGFETIVDVKLAKVHKEGKQAVLANSLGTALFASPPLPSPPQSQHTPTHKMFPTKHLLYSYCLK